LSAEEKHGIDWAKDRALSHRARAFIELARACLRAPEL
jgi:XTP/dITP diphosphohydrolase